LTFKNSRSGDGGDAHTVTDKHDHVLRFALLDTQSLRTLDRLLTISVPLLPILNGSARRARGGWLLLCRDAGRQVSREERE